MKKLAKLFLLVFVFMLLFTAANSQVYKYRAFQTSSWTKETSNNSLEWNETDILVVINVDKSQIRIFAKSEKNIDIINYHKATQTDDGDNLYTYTGVDEAGLKLNVELVVYSNSDQGKHKATIILKYKDLNLVYRLKEN